MGRDGGVAHGDACCQEMAQAAGKGGGMCSRVEAHAGAAEEKTGQGNVTASDTMKALRYCWFGNSNNIRR